MAGFMLATMAPGLIASATSDWDYLLIFGNIAGFGALLALLIYMTGSLSLPVHVRRARHSLRFVPHVRVPGIGAAIWLVPLWGTLKPGQVYPFSTYPYLAPGLIALYTAYAVMRPDRGAAAEPEFVEAPSGTEASLSPSDAQELDCVAPHAGMPSGRPR